MPYTTKMSLHPLVCNVIAFLRGSQMDRFFPNNEMALYLAAYMWNRNLRILRYDKYQDLFMCTAMLPSVAISHLLFIARNVSLITLYAWITKTNRIHD